MLTEDFTPGTQFTMSSLLPVFVVEQNPLRFSAVMPPRNKYDAIWPLRGKVSRSQNRKYITYRNAVRGGPSHDHRQRAHKIWPCGFCELFKAEK